VRKMSRLLKWVALAVLLFVPVKSEAAQEVAATPAPIEQAAPKSELDNLKKEWEAVREQQIQMIREKEEQLEKLKEEIFAKMKTLNTPTVASTTVSQPEAPKASTPILPVDNFSAAALGDSVGFEAQKAALQAERKKFFSEMNRQKESLLRLQASLDEKTKQLEAERKKFELEKKAAVS